MRGHKSLEYKTNIFSQHSYNKFIRCVQISYSLFDCMIRVLAGFICYFMKMADFPMVPLILTFILGDKLEMSLGQSMTMFSGNMMLIFQRPICVVLIAIIVITLIFGIFRKEKIKKTLGGEESEI